MPALLIVLPSKPMSPRAKICQMVPTTFQGIRSGNATNTNDNEARHPCAGIVRATPMPSGIWITSTAIEKISWRNKAPCKSLSRITARNHSMPTKTD